MDAASVPVNAPNPGKKTAPKKALSSNKRQARTTGHSRQISWNRDQDLTNLAHKQMLAA